MTEPPPIFPENGCICTCVLEDFDDDKQLQSWMCRVVFFLTLTNVIDEKEKLRLVEIARKRSLMWELQKSRAAFKGELLTTTYSPQNAKRNQNEIDEGLRILETKLSLVQGDPSPYDDLFEDDPRGFWFSRDLIDVTFRKLHDIPVITLQPNDLRNKVITKDGKKCVRRVALLQYRVITRHPRTLDYTQYPLDRHTFELSMQQLRSSDHWSLQPFTNAVPAQHAVEICNAVWSERTMKAKSGGTTLQEKWNAEVSQSLKSRWKGIDDWEVDYTEGNIVVRLRAKRVWSPLMIMQFIFTYITFAVSICIMLIPPNDNFAFRFSLSLSFFASSTGYAYAMQSSIPKPASFTYLTWYSLSPYLLCLCLIASIIITDRHSGERKSDLHDSISLNEAFFWGLQVTWFLVHVFVATFAARKLSSKSKPHQLIA
mmetsp:Transcript_23032/g.91336  ORF Transcript_23032/g.91336 Transcript_23032/m.91336 type:complete len:427 (+) Transcript_23032:187-1467(+)